MNCEGGSLRVFASDKGVTQIDFLEEIEPSEITRHPILKQALAELEEYFAGQRRVFDVPLDLQVGTDFQREAWERLKSIPYGQTISYGEQAKSMGRPKAFRAVGGANGKNPLPVIIPCHRVVNSLGKLHGFAGGVAMKRYLLRVEGLNLEA
ncbi:MAG: methylated-DNA--[protein]-cysteine S-methyltransferase [Proteobacteria bacterium]|nr:MAG: methylated-DNA--[protein]-cysteine S-methyltransferase [Pseudomonadota bacterium]